MYDDAEGQRRRDGQTFFKINCISLREAIAELCVSCTSQFVDILYYLASACTSCVCLILTFSMLSLLVSAVARTVESSLLLIGSININYHVILGLRLALKWASWT